MTNFIGVDLGGTKICAVAYDGKYRQVIARHTIATDRLNGADSVIHQVITLTQMIADQVGWSDADITAVGVGVPATVNYERGTTVLLPNIPGDWTNKPIVAPIAQAIKRPVALINDARAFTLAEALMGAGRDYPIVAGLTLGTGIGGGIAINGQLILGMDGSAGEFGHLSIDYNGLPDGSNTPGGLEGYCSGPAMAAMAIKAILQGADTTIGQLVDHNLNAITPEIIARAADEGDAVAQGIIQRVGEYIGIGVALVLGVLNPHALVVGGGVAHLGERIFTPMRDAIKKYNRTTSVDQLSILIAQVEDAGAVGAALWAQQRLDTDKS